MGDYRENNALEASWGMGASKCRGNPGSWVIVSPPRATQGCKGWPGDGVGQYWGPWGSQTLTSLSFSHGQAIFLCAGLRGVGGVVTR